MIKCTCKACSGRGYVPCDECDGSGSQKYKLLEIRAHDLRDLSDDQRTSVIELQSAARDVVRQCVGLKKLMPQNSQKYDEQCAGIMDELSKEAEALLK